MTYGRNTRFFPGMGVAALALLLAACSSTDVEDVPMAAGRSGGPTETGSFPNLNIPPKAATAQFSDEETQAKLAQLRSVQHTQSPGTTTETPEARRKRLKLEADEQAETLKVIESQ